VKRKVRIFLLAFLTMSVFSSVVFASDDDDDDSANAGDAAMSALFGAMGQAVQQGAAMKQQRLQQQEQQREERQREIEMLQERQRAAAESQQAAYNAQVQAQQQAQERALEQRAAAASAHASAATIASQARSSQVGRSSTGVPSSAGYSATQNNGSKTVSFSHDYFVQCSSTEDPSSCTFNVAVTNEGNSVIDCIVEAQLEKPNLSGGTLNVPARDGGRVWPNTTSTVSSNFASGGSYTVTCN